VVTEQESLLPKPELKVGETVWWTHGLSHLVCTYKDGDKVRPESMELVRIEAVGEEVPLYSGHGFSNRTVRVYSFDEGRDYFVHPRWLSHDEKVPCEAVLEAYGIWL
jgi:hypothetical protein